MDIIVFVFIYLAICYHISDKDTIDLFEWNEEGYQDYQCYFPEMIGYEILRSVRKIK